MSSRTTSPIPSPALAVCSCKGNMQRFILILSLASCSPADTVCGQYLDTSQSDWLTVEALQQAETEFISAALLVAGDTRLSTPLNACKWLEGVRVLPMPSPTWVDEYGRTVAGLAYPAKDWTLTQHAPGGFVVIGSAPSWRSSALVHEFIHIIQGGIPASPCAKTDDSHCGWHRPGGEYALVDALSR